MSFHALFPVAISALLVGGAPAFAQSTQVPSPAPVAGDAATPTPVVVSPSGKSDCPYGTKVNS